MCPIVLIDAYVLVSSTFLPLLPSCEIEQSYCSLSLRALPSILPCPVSFNAFVKAFHYTDLIVLILLICSSLYVRFRICFAFDFVIHFSSRSVVRNNITISNLDRVAPFLSSAYFLGVHKSLSSLPIVRVHGSRVQDYLCGPHLKSASLTRCGREQKLQCYCLARN